MDFLEKALDKVGRDEVTVKDELPKPELINTKLNTSEIVYTTTQKITLNNEMLRDRRVVAMQKHDPIADYFRMLRTKVLKQMRANKWNSFAITAPTRGVGKSMVATNLAISIAMEVNQTVLLVDFDLRIPRLKWYFDADVKYGILDYLNSDVPLNQILFNPGIERLVVLPGVGDTRDSSELISSPKMKQLVEDIKNRYSSRIIIFDMPPILAIDDVLAASEYYDAVLLVIEDGVSKASEITKSLQMLSNTNLLGTVLNKSQNPPDHQGYGYY
ncbi:CpsD/CapB family tyrosine-protein kinase [Methylomonas sp. AM2-LC]|uniref:CpsD/CapB family tyrosine-protein kinase n=1 Tax=Methylomonas sp. AM2-LC TaxID=3153301 RepID=UPI003266704E